MILANWRTALRDHPDRALVDRLLTGISHGVDVAYTGARDRLRTSCRNLQSANERPEALEADLREDCRLGRKAGPFDDPPLPNFIASPLGAVPKKNGKIRVIHHLSWPRHDGSSVNAQITHLECKLASFDSAVDLIAAVGRGALLCKIDIKAAYRCIKVREEDWHLLGMKWKGKYYVDRCLPMGLSSSCSRWEDFATAAEWIARNLGLKALIHYIDDYLLVCGPDMAAALQKLRSLLWLFCWLGLPVAMDKLDGPATLIVYLGVELDTVAMQARLPRARLDAILTALGQWSTQQRCTARELQSLIGVLSFATKVVRPGRMFLRRMLDLLRISKRIDSPRKGSGRSHAPSIRLTEGFRADLQWWRHFATDWNGVSLLYAREWATASSLRIATDACATGAGAMCFPDWFHHAWTIDELTEAGDSMPYLELRALVLAAATFGTRWAGKRVLFECDCLPVVEAVTRLSSPSPHIMALIRTLFLLAARSGFEFKLQHVPGVSNEAADALSRAQIPRFRLLVPEASPSPTTPSAIPILSW